MFKLNNSRERTVHRLKIARGHLEKVLKMVEEQEYCIDILHQSQAVQKALFEIDSLILENHLTTCATNKIKEGKGEEAIAEIMEVFRKNK
ncbi:MAG: hypothetical protein A3F31_00285 [Candidatus Levybacteria bacterium RIFCSPHIGHO2_12_FULL_38_12]|nr:MAG: hypothetical protein A2770_03355 [Candidatus Levybacteria bacterium RIFCSPHIGHO2_01_FULL_38_12]OGH23198.1 MAG: hypothetical protein A3F31_00285 [Candidatus Levybacteria bacterium RIFCSPHIGHO2_12_FULL_38_12]OGH34476.1 MAG: hypothetical protein A3A47_00805 [Candidatus Levybacteria bacterium RIFCSPLOWO2_01_FULL_37_20]OGH44724.1 MAG: hypothetical protein A3J14_00165 [Candidatus Levybacteria bacterium RIFCSPLOWO2_02_FULL_37_18]